MKILKMMDCNKCLSTLKVAMIKKIGDFCPFSLTQLYNREKHARKK